MVTSPEYQMGEYGFPGLIEALTAFPKPLICADRRFVRLHITRLSIASLMKPAPVMNRTI